MLFLVFLSWTKHSTACIGYFLFVIVGWRESHHAAKRLLEHGWGPDVVHGYVTPGETGGWGVAGHRVNEGTEVQTLGAVMGHSSQTCK
jgi:hypothetical protein